MAFFPFRKPQSLADMQEQGGKVVADVREAALHAASHASALVQLFRVELQEYGACQARRLLALVVGLLLLLVAYLAFCAALCVVLQGWLDSWLLAAGAVCLVNALLGVFLLLAAIWRKPGPLAPATRQELKDDVQCLKILLRPESRKS